MHGVVAAIRLHIERHDPLNERDVNGETALMIAARRNHLEACALLIEAGADPSLQDSSGFTAANHAEKFGALDTFRFLSELAIQRTNARGFVEPNLGHESRESIGINVHFSAESPEHRPQEPGSEEVKSVDWEPVVATEPPKDDAELHLLSRRAQEAMGSHVPLDSSAASWEDVSVYLPERVEESTLSDALVEGLRNLFLRALREGSIPLTQLELLLEEDGPLNPASIRRLATQSIHDFGSELDERLEERGTFEDYRVFQPEETTEEELSTLDEVFEYLGGLLQGGNDPSRLFARQAYSTPLLTQSEEIELAKSMERALGCAVDALASWPAGLQVLLRRCGEIRSGQLNLKQVCVPRSSELEEIQDSESTFTGQKAEGGSDRSEPQIVDGEDGSEQDDEPTEEGNEEFMQLVDDLTTIASSSEMISTSKEKIRKLVEEMSLSGPFLCSVGQEIFHHSRAHDFHHFIKEYLEARERLILSNLKLVVPLVKRYHRTGADFLDLLQEAHIGLIKAVDKFDWRRGYRFSTMATWWIRQQVSRAAPELVRLIRLPTHAVESSWELRRVFREYEEQYDKSPTISWLAKTTGMPDRRVDSYLRTVLEPLSLETLDSDGWLPRIEEEPQESAIRTEAARIIDDALRAIGSKPQGKMPEKVLRMRYGIGIGHEMTLDEIGRRFNLTRERIRQIETKGLRLIRGHMRVGERSQVANSEIQERDALDDDRGISREETFFLPSGAELLVGTEELPGNQQAVLLEAQALGIGVMSYRIEKKYKTLVMLPHATSDAEKAVASKLQETGFEFKPGQGYLL